MLQRLTLTCLLSALACSSSSKPPAPVCAGLRADISTRYALVGREAEVRFFLLKDCEAPTGLEASVLDAHNTPVASTMVFDDSGGAVRFTPTAVGEYHVTARFQPNLGLGQLDVVAAVDRSAEPGLPVPDCRVPQLTRAGLLFCAGVTSHQLFRVSDAGVTLITDQYVFDAVAVDDVVWASAPLQRLVVTDAGYSPAPRMESMSADLRPRWPTRDDAIVRGSTGYALATVADDGGLDLRPLNIPSSQAVLWRAGGVLITMGGGSECVRDLDGGSECGPIAVLLGSTITGGDATGFWGSSSDRTTLYRHGLGLGEVTSLATGYVPGTGGVFLDYTVGGVPRITAAGRDFIPAPNRPDIVLEYWGDLYGATSSAVVTRTDAGFFLHAR